MKALSVFLLFVFLSFSGWSQDAIIKRDGTKMLVKVVEITATTIKYRNFDQPDGPLRNVAINDVEEIIYNDGSWEKFNKNESPVTQSEEPVRPSKSSREEKDHIILNGFFIEGLIGINSIYQENNNYSYYYDEFGNYIEEPLSSRDTYASISVRFGNKWYFGSNEKWRPGIQLTYLKLGLYLNYFSERNSFSIGNIGFANVFKLKENIGLEANANFGLTIMNALPLGELNPGINYGVEVKFRNKALAFGIDYSRMGALPNYLSTDTSMDVISVTIGTKF